MQRPAESAAARPWAVGALLLVASGLVLGAVFFGGGSGDDAVPWLGGLAVLAAAAVSGAAALGALPFPRLDRGGAVALGAAGALVAWTGVSVVWSIAGDRSWAALGKGLVYVAFLVLGLAVAAAASPRAARTVAALAAGVLGLALAWALLGRAVPGLFPDGGRVPRLRNPVGYWNALALLADAAIPLGLWVATGQWNRRRRPLRVAGALLVYAAVLAVLLTQSRAGVGAAVVVAALWLALSPARLTGGLLGLLAATPALAVAGWAFTRPALVDPGASAGERADDGAVFAALALGGAVVVAVAALAVPIERLAARHGRTLVRGLAVAAAGFAAAGLLGLVAAVGNPVAWAGDQFSGGECVNTPGRFLEGCANNRLTWWGEALDVFADHPAGGTGASTFEIARRRVRDDATAVSQPHSVPLQLLSDTGLVGFLLGVALAGGIAVGAASTLRRLAGSERDAATALVALPAAYAVHALVDFDLDFLAVTAPTLFAGGVLLAAGRQAVVHRGGRVGAAAATVSAVAVLAVLVAPWLAERDVDRATRAVDAGRLDDAADLAERARSLNPLSLEPLYAAALVAEQRGDDALALAFYRRATRLQPENPEPWIMLGRFEILVREDLCGAYQALNDAYTLDPNGRQWVPGGQLDIARDAVNRGACER